MCCVAHRDVLHQGVDGHHQVGDVDVKRSREVAGQKGAVHLSRGGGVSQSA